MGGGLKDKEMHNIVDKGTWSSMNGRIALSLHICLLIEEGAIDVLACAVTKLGNWDVSQEMFGTDEERQVRHISRRTDVRCGEDGWDN